MEFGNAAIAVILSLIVASLFIATSGKSFASIMGDHTAKTELTALGIRNSMIYVLSSESGRMNYNTAGGEEYAVDISNDKISVTYAGAVIKKSFKPTVELFHTMPKTVGKSVVSNSFCIAKKQDLGCNTYVELCKADDASCCKTEVCGG